eukprot:5963063-Ditylum_brightwellii.AAC.1
MMEDDEFIPCSSHIEFTLMVSKEAEKDQEFKDLQETMNKIITNCRKSLKEQILKCINVEYKLLHQQIINDFAKAFDLSQSNALSSSRTLSILMRQYLLSFWLIKESS